MANHNYKIHPNIQSKILANFNERLDRLIKVSDINILIDLKKEEEENLQRINSCMPVLLHFNSMADLDQEREHLKGVIRVLGNYIKILQMDWEEVPNSKKIKWE